MALTAAQLALVAAFVAETEDFALAKIIETFLIKHGTVSASPGANAVTFAVDPGDVTADDAYDDTTYVITIVEALDGSGIDVRGELSITDKTVNGFTVNAASACTIKWQTSRLAPKINFNTAT